MTQLKIAMRRARHPQGEAVLGSRSRLQARPGRRQRRSLRPCPGFWFQQMDAPRPQRNRIHVDVTVPHDVAKERIAHARGGRHARLRRRRAGLLGAGRSRGQRGLHLHLARAGLTETRSSRPATRATATSPTPPSAGRGATLAAAGGVVVGEEDVAAPGVEVAPAALQWVVVVEGAAAGEMEDGVDDVDAGPHRVGRGHPDGEALLPADLVAGDRGLPGRGDACRTSEHLAARSVRLAPGDLELGHLLGGEWLGPARPLAGECHELVQRARRATPSGNPDISDAEQGEERPAEVRLVAWCLVEDRTGSPFESARRRRRLRRRGWPSPATRRRATCRRSRRRRRGRRGTATPWWAVLGGHERPLAEPRAWGLPLLNGNRPVSRTAPSLVGSVRPIGANRPAMPARGSICSTRPATAGSSQQLKNVVLRIIEVQPVEPSARDSSSTISQAVIGSTWVPPSEAGTKECKTPADPSLRTRSSGTDRAASVSKARAGHLGAQAPHLGEAGHRGIVGLGPRDELRGEATCAGGRALCRLELGRQFAEVVPVTELAERWLARRRGAGLLRPGGSRAPPNGVQKV